MQIIYGDVEHIICEVCTLNELIVALAPRADFRHYIEPSVEPPQLKWNVIICIDGELVECRPDMTLESVREIEFFIQLTGG